MDDIVEQEEEKKPLINIWPQTLSQCAFQEFATRAKNMLNSDSAAVKTDGD